MNSEGRSGVAASDEGAAMAVKPRVVLSRCLELEACRYNGAGIRSAVVRALDGWVEWVPVCPEVEIGLGVPRAPIRIERAGADGGGQEAALRLVQPSTGRDLTARMRAFGHGFADGLGPVDGLLLKSRSPSCGIGDVKIHEGDAVAATAGTGMFAAVLRDRLPGVAMADEARLADAAVRRVWLARVYDSARRRAGAGAEAPGGAPYPPGLAAALEREGLAG